MEMRKEIWNGNRIRFVKIDDEWYAVLKDICKALALNTFKVSQRLDSDMIRKEIISDVNDTCDIPSKYVSSVKSGHRHTQNMILINELGIYEALFNSRKLEARQLRKWTGTVLQRLRKKYGFEGYEVMCMTDTKVQEEIDHMLDDYFWNDDDQKLYKSVTVQGGDVEQVEVDPEEIFI